MKKIFTRIFLICLLLPALAKAQSPDLVISQVSVASNFNPSAYTRSYIEIFNRSSVPVNLAGYSIQLHFIDWNNVVVLPNKVLHAGQYFLIVGGYKSGGLQNISNSDQFSYTLDNTYVRLDEGEVILAKKQFALPGNYCPATVEVIDKVSWGTGECYEGPAAVAAGADYLHALTRSDNGCQDTDNNQADFSWLPANPRSTLSSRNICGLGTSAFISAGPVVSGIITRAGTVSPSKMYALTGYNLTPASGTITLTPPSQDFEISVDNINFSTAAISFPYTNGQLPDTNIYVRISTNLSVPGTGGTSIVGNIIHSGGGAPNAVLPLNGFFVDPPGLVVSQVYHGAVPSVTTPYGRNYIEIFNGSTQPIRTAGYSIQLRIVPYQVGSGGWSTSYPLPDTIINAGQYFLIGQNSLYGTNDIAANMIIPFNFSYADYIGGVAISKTTDRFLSCDFSTNNNVVDRVIWSANALGCQEGVGIGYGSFEALYRKNAGCQDTNENAADFITGAAAPRNLSSAFNICGLGSSPLISAGPAVNLKSVEGTAGPSGYYNIAAYNLSPAAGNLTVTPPSPNFEVSLDNTNFSALPISIPYNGGGLPVTKVYVRISNLAPFGNAITADIINGGANATAAIVKVNGAIGREYYNTKADMGLNNTGTWATSPDGTGSSPVDFNAANQRYHIVDQTNAHFNGEWNVSGNDCKIILGDGINPVSLTINAADSITSHSIIDVLANATLVMKHNSMPALGKIETGSTIDFAQAGITNADTIHIPRRNYYNLKLTNGLKYLSGDSLNMATLMDHIHTVVEHDLTVDGVVSFNAFYTNTYPNSYFTYLICKGDINFLNGAAFEPEATGSLQRFSLSMMGTQTQHINSNGTSILLYGMSTTTADVICSPNTDFVFSEGLYVAANTILSTTDGSFTTIQRGTFQVFGKIASDETSFHLLRDGFISQSAETLSFTPGSTIKDLEVNISNMIPVLNPADSFYIGTDIDITGNLSLTKGRIIVMPGATLHLTSTGTVTGGSIASYVQGAYKRSGAGPFTYHVGNVKLRKYAPLDFSNYTGNNTYTVSYKKENYPVNTIDPVTLAANPLYAISGHEYWNITPAAPGGTVNIEFHYNDNNSQILDPGAVGIAHFDGTDWNNVGGLPDPSNTTDVGSVLVFNVADFSPFTFGGTADVVIPVKLNSFTVKKQTGSVLINWVTEQEINSKLFIVERSTDQNSWNVISTLNAAGNSAEKINYNTTDFKPAKGINYYRLKQVDVDGRFTYSEIRSVYFGTDANVVIAPNPAKDKITVYLPGNDSFASIGIYDMNARLIKTINTNEESVQIDLQGIAKGIYMVKINGKNISDVKKLLIQ